MRILKADIGLFDKKHCFLQEEYSLSAPKKGGWKYNPDQILALPITDK